MPFYFQIANAPRSSENKALWGAVDSSSRCAAGQPPRLSRVGRSLAGALALVAIVAGISPAAAHDTEVTGKETADPGAMSVDLKDSVTFNYGVQMASQGAGTPNQAGIGAFIPLHAGNNGVTFLDVLVNANFDDFDNYSSIINTDVAGTTFSTSTRLGYRWFNDNGSWLFGVNAGYDSRSMATGGDDSDVAITNHQTVSYQQVTAGLEAISNSWSFNAYALVPIGDKEKHLNSVYEGGALHTYGLDIGYSLTPELHGSVGYYHQRGDLGSADGSGLRGRLAYSLTNGLTVGTNFSRDDAFDGRFSVDITYRFGAAGCKKRSATRERKTPMIQSLTAPLRNRDVRVHDLQLA